MGEIWFFQVLFKINDYLFVKFPSTTEHLVCYLLCPSVCHSCYKIKIHDFFSPTYISILDFNKCSLNLLVCIPFHDFCVLRYLWMLWLTILYLKMYTMFIIHKYSEYFTRFLLTAEVDDQPLKDIIISRINGSNLVSLLHIMDLLLLGCCTRFSCSLIK